MESRQHSILFTVRVFVVVWGLLFLMTETALASMISYSIQGFGDAQGWYGHLAISECGFAYGDQPLDDDYIENAMLSGKPLEGDSIGFYYSIGNCNIFDGNGAVIVSNTPGWIQISILGMGGGDVNKSMSTWRIGDPILYTGIYENDVTFRGSDNLECQIGDYDKLPQYIQLYNGMDTFTDSYNIQYNLLLTKMMPVPEPEMIILFGMGILICSAVGFRKTKRD